jgi:hypothetical protein
MSIALADHSRLRFADLLRSDKVVFWDTLDLPEVVVQGDDQKYTVQSNDRIDRLAHKFYGDSVLWWVLAAANNMELLPTALYSGQVLRVPSPRYVLQELFKGAKVR